MLQKLWDRHATWILVLLVLGVVAVYAGVFDSLGIRPAFTTNYFISR